MCIRDRVVTVEEHSIIGGLGSAVCDCLSEKAPTKVLKIGVNDVYGESGPAKDCLLYTSGRKSCLLLPIYNGKEQHI